MLISKTILKEVNLPLRNLEVIQLLRNTMLQFLIVFFFVFKINGGCWQTAVRV